MDVDSIQNNEESKETKEKTKETSKKRAQEIINQNRINNLISDINRLSKGVLTNEKARDLFISKFNELINDKGFKGSKIEIFNSFDTATRNIIYHNKELMQKVMGDMFKSSDKGKEQEPAQEINKFVKNLKKDLEGDEYNLINHPENDEVLKDIIDEFDKKNNILDEDAKNLLKSTEKLIEYQKVKREILRNNKYYKKSDNSAKSEMPTLEKCINEAENKEEIERVNELVKDIKFESFTDLENIASKYIKINKTETNEEEENKEEEEKTKEQKEQFIIDYIKKLQTEDLKQFIDNIVSSNSDELTDEQTKFFEFINSQTEKIGDIAQQQIVVSLIENPNIYNKIKKNNSYPNVLNLIEKYHDGKLPDYESRTVLEEKALSRDKDSIKKLKEKIKNGEELSESMKQMLVLYSGWKNKETNKEKKEYKNKLKKQKTTIKDEIKSNNKIIEQIDKDTKKLNKNIEKNEKELKKLQQELSTGYDINKVWFKGSFDKKRQELRDKINNLQNQIENDKKSVSTQQQRKSVLQKTIIKQQNKIEQIDKYMDKGDRGGLEDLYGLNALVENIKQNTKGQPFSYVIKLLNINESEVNIAVLNSYCKNAVNLNDKDFKDFVEYCVEIDDSLAIEDNVKKPLDNLLSKESLARFSSDRIYSLLHNEELKKKENDILNNLSDDDLLRVINKMITQIVDNKELKEEEKDAVVNEKIKNTEIMKNLNIKQLQKDGKFNSLNTVIDYAKGYFNKESTKDHLLNKVVKELEIPKMPNNASIDDINEYKQNAKKTVETLKNIYEIYGENEKIDEQNEIITKLTNSVDNLIDSPEVMYELIDFADTLPKKGDEVNTLKKKIIEKLKNIPEITNNPSKQELLKIENQLKALCKATANNNQDTTTTEIKEEIKKTLNNLIEKKQVDTALNVIASSSNLIKSLNDNNLTDEIYNKIKDENFTQELSEKNTILARTLIQLYNTYEKDTNKTTEKENILNKILSLSNASIVMCIQNGVCDDLLLKIIEKKPEILNNVNISEQNNKIVTQIDGILQNKENSIEEEVKNKMNNFVTSYKQEKEKQEQSQKQNEQQNEQQNNQQDQQQITQSKSEQGGNTFSDFFTNPKEFMNECSKNPAKMMELMMIMNTLSGSSPYPFFQQGKMSEESYKKYMKDPNMFMEKFITNPMKFVGMIGGSADKLQECFQAYLTKHNGKLPDGILPALLKVATYLNNGQQMMGYSNGFSMPNQQPMMYQGGYGVPVVSYPGNVVVPSNVCAIAVNQMRYEQECLSELRKQNKIAKEKLELKRQEVEELRRSNDIKENKEIMMKLFSTKIDGKELGDGNDVEIVYTGPNGNTHKITIAKGK